MPAAPANPRAKQLLLEECLSAQDDRFLETLRALSAPAVLAALVPKLAKDSRPWTRRQLLAYLDQPFTSQGHQVLVKRLFKHAEAVKDDELMGAFLVAFDRLIRRRRDVLTRWDWRSRTSWTEERLVMPRDVLPALTPQGRALENPKTGKLMRTTPRSRPGHKLFRASTRRYLQRRVWRYFRWMGHQRPAAYVPALCAALARFNDADLAQGENLLDSWSLLQACFRSSPELEFDHKKITLKDGGSLATLRAAPRFPALWAAPEAAAPLLGLMARARSRAIRSLAQDLFKQHPRDLAGHLDALLALLNHEDDEVVLFAAAQVEQMPGLDKQPVEFWLRLLETRSLAALDLLTTAFRRHVSPDRLSLPGAVRLACAVAAPVSRLGLDMLARHDTAKPETREQLALLATSACAATAGDAARLALAALGTPEAYHADLATPFFDSRHPAMRLAAWEWLARPESPGHLDSVLWSRLAETPHTDLRLRLVGHWQQRLTGPAVLPPVDDLTRAWASVLLDIHRGSRHKPRAIHQLAATLGARPELAEKLLPVLAVAVRSLRGPEHRAGLAALATLVSTSPELAAAITTHFPELRVA